MWGACGICAGAAPPGQLRPRVELPNVVALSLVRPLSTCTVVRASRKVR